MQHSLQLSCANRKTIPAADCRTKRIRKFSLIELLITISIIAILAALLLPALNKAREQAQQIRCISNLKQCISAVHSYSDDYSDYFMMRRDANNYWRKELNDLRYLTDAVTICPSQPLTMEKGGGQYSRESYAVQSDFPSSSWGFDAYIEEMVTTNSLARFLNFRSKKLKSTLPVFIDSLRCYDLPQQYGDTTSQRSSDIKASGGHPHSRHNKRINSAMLDGSAKSLTPQDYANCYIRGVSWKEMGIPVQTIYCFTQKLNLMPIKPQ